MLSSVNCINLIKKWEGCKLESYKCSAGHWTIGFGNTFYEDNTKVKQGDKITQKRAEALLINLLPKFESIVNKKITISLNQNQFDSLVSYTWNTGGSSTLFSMINRKASNKEIREWFETKYITAGEKVLQGLVNRRKDEANLYFTI
ncbi:lysozyme [bacterium]|nr:lysozyme [bacterium]